MAVEIKITGETAEKGYNELKQLATLIFGNKQEPVKPEPTPEKPETVEQPEVVVEVSPVSDLPTTPAAPNKRTRNSNKAKQEEVKPVNEETKPTEKVNPEEANKPAEETIAPVEETKATEEVKPEETAGNSASPFPAPFDNCADETEVVNMVRERVAVVMGNPETEAKAKAIFIEYKKPTVLKLSLEEKMDFFNKISHL